MNPAHWQQGRSAQSGPGKQKQGMFVSRTFKRLLLAGGLLALAGPVLALGLGRIEVRSHQGQPLLAEIPIVSSDPAELRQLQARLASPETFARIGLEPPRGVVSDLQFNVALDRSGRPVIRVTSAAPVTQEALTFLVEVDWGQGRLVREYSALVAVPDTVAAPAQPTIQAPVVAPAPSIVRPPAAAAPVQAPPPPPQQAAAPTEPPPASDAIATAPPPPPPPTPAPAPTPALAAPAAAAAVTPGDALPAVRAGQTLSAIAAPLADEAGISVNQAMLLLLRTNPEAFIGGNLNLIRQGAVLRVPARDAWTQFSAAEANAVVREQVGQWREMRRPAPQPADPAADATPPTAETPPTAAPRTADARLEITPPASDSQPTGTQSGLAAGAGGDMLRQELQQANETVAARTAEIDELKARLDDLEQLQQQQQQLIQLKDAELAAAQQRMEASNQQQSSVAAPMPWLWLGVAILIVAALAFLLGRRGRTATTKRPFDSAALAAGMPTSTLDATPTAATVPEPATPPAFVRETPAPEPVVEPAPVVVPPASEGPTWHAPSESLVEPVEPENVAVIDATPADDAPVELDSGDAVEIPIGVERIELARAYIDLGDTETARSLLLEVVEGDDLSAAAQAAQLLRTLD
ncbi:type IV pilus assembly protein FimV [Luteimonas terrae]|uniref:Pilus assembly protein FimV n=1 Tax=Luteimonas terrae TaxID=1530191 RepID=A0ABU1XYG2_9GAMM|nr:FimV/HubP family polar landmark protein [Luteimonas terrae]MDR7193788.1 pilus assembly protein FimV [Luteimonas terrae]